MARSFDVVLFGATGFTGRLVTEYLAGRREGARLALAGRDRGKLEALARKLALDVPILVADSFDPAALAEVARDTRVVCTTVGPYAKYGAALVAACAASGTSYCDLTGEPHFVRRMIDAHHEEARRTGARIVHACGFDSIPSDLGVHALQAHALASHGAPCQDVTLAILNLRGGASGGTVASMLNIVDEARRDPAVREVLKNPYSLNPEGDREGPRHNGARKLGWSAELDSWTGPFVMAAINERVVRRSHALRGHPWGREFRYHEIATYPRGPRGLVRAALTTAGMGALLAAAALPPARALIERRLPRPGEGPSRERRERGYFEASLRGHGTGRDGRPFVVRARVAGRGDPGYAATARMLGEAALCLAQDELASPGGVLTPAFAMGDHLLARLRAAGMTFAAPA